MSTEEGQQLQNDLAWCHSTVHDVSRTFSLTISALERPMADEICVAYLLCRVADTVEDAQHVPAGTAVQLLQLYSRALDPDSPDTIADFRSAVDPWIPASPSADWQVVDHAPRIVDTFEALPEASQVIIRPSVQELTDGLAIFVDRYIDEGGLRIQTFDELEQYCWYAAGTVGNFVTDLIARDRAFTVTETVRDDARSFALLLQLVNVAKDVYADFHEENNVYVPLELFAAHDLAPADIENRPDGQCFAPVIKQVVERAESYLNGAQAWLESAPTVRGYRSAAGGVPYLLAVATIRELSCRSAAVVTERPVKISREEVHTVLAQFSGNTDPSLDELRRTIRQRPLHEI